MMIFEAEIMMMKDKSIMIINQMVSEITKKQFKLVT